MKESIQNKLRMMEYYRTAMKTLREHEGAKQLLGEPIKDAGFDLADKENKSDHYNAFYKVKVIGPNNRGIMYFWAERQDIKESWNVKRIELELKDQPDRRLVVKKEEVSK